LFGWIETSVMAGLQTAKVPAFAGTL